MIQFPCTGCGRVLTVSDDESVRAVRCVHCRRLNHGPAWSRQGNGVDDGTIALKERDDIVTVGSEGSVGDPDESSVAPLEVLPGAPAAELPPVPVASIAMNYAPAGHPELIISPVFWRLFQPANLFVMIFVLVALAIGYAVQLLLAWVGGLWGAELVLWPFNFMFWLAACHFGNCILVIGPEGHDELPRPLHSLDLWEDILGPLIHVVGAFGLCYAPMLLVLAAARSPVRLVALPLMLVGGYFFPAVLLTLTASGSFLDLQPRRLANVIRTAGTGYLLLVLVWVVTLPLYLWATLRVNPIFDALRIALPRHEYRDVLLSIPIAAVAVVALHYFCWKLGLLFRAGHDRFGWTWEEVLRERERDRVRRGLATTPPSDEKPRRRREAAPVPAATPRQPLQQE